MNTLSRACAVLAIWSLAASTVGAQDTHAGAHPGTYRDETAPNATHQHVYPKHGQSHSRQRRDEAHCSSWAQEQTGFDPTTPPPATVSAQPVTGSGARLVGAGGGAIVGGIAGNAGAGALIGAATGGIVKRSRNNRAAGRENAANYNAWQTAQDSYLRARATCLRGRGYSVG
ncbi:MAG TPA: hypothetical protein VN694_13490 [Caulobacteraceae bacterium]|nr:hypothetical protein [Caulobacteraceae bacterium]